MNAIPSTDTTQGINKNTKLEMISKVPEPIKESPKEF
jgi:hypothetical protein